MKIKTLITVILLVFVGASFVYLAVDEPAKVVEETAAAPDDEEAGHRVVAYYFHGHKRCKTCLQIEASAKAALEDNFQKELDEGTLEWKKVNFEDEANSDMAEKYELVASSLIIAEFRDGEEVRWKNLEKVWELVWEDEAYADYVRREVADYLFSDVNDG